MRILSLILTGLALSLSCQADIIVSSGTGGVQRYTDSGVSLGVFIAPGFGGLNDARGVAISPVTGDVFVADFFDQQILRYSSTGAFLNVFASGASIGTPFDLSFGTGGDLYASTNLDEIIRLNPSTGAIIDGSFTFGNVTPIGGPHYMSFGPVLAVTDIAGHLFRFDAATGNIITTSFLDNPIGVGFNAGGDLFVAQRISNNVLKRPFGSNTFTEVIPMGAFAGSPTDLVFGPNGLLYLGAGNNIYRLDVSGPAGVLVDSFAAPGVRYIAFTPIPEPGTWAISALGLTGLGVLRRRRSVQ